METMSFLDKRINGICTELQKLSVKQKFPTDNWLYKPGNFLRPEDADADPAPFEAFDCRTMHWYGPDKHYWFRADLTVPETQQKNALLDLFEALTGCMEPDACYYACVTFGTKTWPLVLSSALRYAEKLLDGTEVKGVYYREITRKAGEQTGVAQYDVSALFTLDSIIDLAAGAGVEDRQAFLRLLLHPDREA